MNRFVKYIISTSTLALLSICQLNACGHAPESVADYLMYRVYDPTSKVIKEEGLRKRNCEAWLKILSITEDNYWWNPTVEEVYEAVYTFSYKDIDEKYNEFVSFLQRYDKDALELLLLSKKNEMLRSHINSPWYYPTMNIGDGAATLEDVVNIALSCNNERLRPRYVVQAMRALVTLNCWEECWDLWVDECSQWPEDNPLREIAEPYARGAAFRLWHKEDSEAYFANTEDIESIFYLHKIPGNGLSATLEKMEYIYQYAPSSPAYAKLLQKLITQNELYSYGRTDEDMKNVRNIIDFALKVVRGGKSDNPALWLYTASFLKSEWFGEYGEAYLLARKAMKANGNQYVHDSARILNMYLDAKASTFDSSYESRLLADMRWLDEKIVNNITDEVRDNFDELYWNHSFYYWNDMMRRVLLGTTAPKMLEVGMGVRALQLANYGSNRLRMLLKKVKGEDMASTHFFMMINSVEPNLARKYVESVRLNGSTMDNFLNERSYLSNNYLCDIVGTLMLRSRRYAEAEEYLGRVTSAYKGFLNIQAHNTYDPFSLTRKKIDPQWDYRYRFAKRMHSLEKSMASADNNNDRGRFMAEYAIGMRQSFTDCWPLTLYGYGYYYCHELNNSSEPLRKAGVKEAGQCMERALSIISDEELAARINYSIYRFNTVAKDYPNTFMAGYVRGHCDNPYDHDWLDASLYFN